MSTITNAVQNSLVVNTQSGGNAALAGLTLAVVQPRAPTTADIVGPVGTYPLGQGWVDYLTNAFYVLTSYSVSNGTVTANWQGSAGTGILSTLTGDSGGAIAPSAGNINLKGTTNQIVTTGSGSTITWSIPSTFVAPGTITASTGLTVTAGNLTLSGTGAGFVLPVVVVAQGASPQVGNGRFVQVIFSSVSIAGGSEQQFVLTNSAIAGSSTNFAVNMYGCTNGAALTIQSVVPSTGSVAITVANGTGATTSTANITFIVQVLD